MSIYCSIWDIGDEHAPRCAKLTKVEPRVYRQDDSKQCTCGSSPLVYQQSHVLPSDKHKRGGSIGIAAIPYHIRHNGHGDFHPWCPWLRVSIDADEADGHLDATIVLTRKQAEKFRDALTKWLETSAKK